MRLRLRCLLVDCAVRPWTASRHIVCGSGRPTFSAFGDIKPRHSESDVSLRLWTFSGRVRNSPPTTRLWPVTEAEAPQPDVQRIRVRWSRRHVAVKQILLYICYSATIYRVAQKKVSLTLIMLIILSVSMSIIDLQSAESWSISTALCVLSGNDEIGSFSAIVWSCCWWAPGHGDCPVA